MHLRELLIIPTVATALLSSGHAATIISSGSGHWNTDAATAWTGGVAPRTGSQASALDSAEIISGHIITYTAIAPGTGGTNNTGGATNDFSIGNGNVVTINGGTFAHTNSAGNWVRIGSAGQGTLDIKDGVAYIPVGNLQVGVIPSSNGAIRIGDGTGAAGSAVLNMRDALTGSTVAASGHVSELNLGSQQNNAEINSAGFITIESDGILEGAAHTTTGSAGAWTYNPSTTRIGRYGSDTESVILVKAGGKFNVRGNLEIGANRTATGLSAKGLLHLDGAGANTTHSHGELTIGYTGDGRMIVENGAEYIRLNNAIDATSGVIMGRNNHYIGRNAAGTGTLLIQTGGKFIRDTGGNVGDLFIGNSGVGTVTVQSNGEFINRSTNWDWFGVGSGSRGSLYINSGGKYLSSSTTVLGRDAANSTLAAAKGLIEINQGEMTIGDLHVGQNGEGGLYLIDGTVSVNKLSMARGAGTGVLDMRGGTLLVRGNFFMGGDTGDFVNDTNPGVATATQSAGVVTATNAMSIGLSTGHTATYTMTGGEFYHLNSNVTVGEKGTGTFTVGANAKFYDNSSAVFFIGRENGSNGTFIVDGLLEKADSATGIRVGHGNTAGENNTSAVGYLGGSGIINAAGGVTVGNLGTLGAGTRTTLASLTINGNLNLISTVGSTAQSTLFVNFNSSNALGADRITVNGDITLQNAVISGAWTTGSATGLDSRYWVIVNEGSDVFLGDLYFDNMYLESSNLLASSYLSLGADGFVMIDGMEFAMFYEADFNTRGLSGGNDLLLSAMGSAVPEPSKVLLCLGALGALLMRRRRR